MNIKPIKTKKDYKEVLKKIESLFNSKPDTHDGDTLEVLVTLVEAYEQKHFYIAPPDPVKAIRFRINQLGLKQSDLADAIGGKNRVSEILNRRRGLTVKMMKELHRRFNIPAESLLAG